MNKSIKSVLAWVTCLALLGAMAMADTNASSKTKSTAKVSLKAPVARIVIRDSHERVRALQRAVASR